MCVGVNVVGDRRGGTDSLWSESGYCGWHSYNQSCPSDSTPAADVQPTGHVHKQAVLESQEEIVRAIRGVSDQLDQIISVLGDICNAVNALKK